MGKKMERKIARYTIIRKFLWHFISKISDKTLHNKEFMFKRLT